MGDLEGGSGGSVDPEANSRGDAAELVRARTPGDDAELAATGPGLVRVTAVAVASSGGKEDAAPMDCRRPGVTPATVKYLSRWPSLTMVKKHLCSSNDRKL